LHWFYDLSYYMLQGAAGGLGGNETDLFSAASFFDNATGVYQEKQNGSARQASIYAGTGVAV